MPLVDNCCTLVDLHFFFFFNNILLKNSVHYMLHFLREQKLMSL